MKQTDIEKIIKSITKDNFSYLESIGGYSITFDPGAPNAGGVVHEKLDASMYTHEEREDKHGNKYDHKNFSDKAKRTSTAKQVELKNKYIIEAKDMIQSILNGDAPNTVYVQLKELVDNIL